MPKRFSRVMKDPIIPTDEHANEKKIIICQEEESKDYSTSLECNFLENRKYRISPVVELYNFILSKLCVKLCCSEFKGDSPLSLTFLRNGQHIWGVRIVFLAVESMRTNVPQDGAASDCLCEFTDLQ
uniref:Uncharacterized protein n=1 Tax=Molossus molossus TaxID=27622 RepID=A0A7J8I8M5_MOLMO|nr:hypothetical protein HJG59_010525 [Molossus molossus]